MQPPLRVRRTPLMRPGFRHAYWWPQQGTRAAAGRAAGQHAALNGWHVPREHDQPPVPPQTRLRPAPQADRSPMQHHPGTCNRRHRRTTNDQQSPSDTPKPRSRLFAGMPEDRAGLAAKTRRVAGSSLPWNAKGAVCGTVPGEWRRLPSLTLLFLSSGLGGRPEEEVSVHCDVVVLVHVQPGASLLEDG